MPKLLSDILGTAEKKSVFPRLPEQDLDAKNEWRQKSPDAQRFIEKHEIQHHEDRNGNGDEVFNASNVKTYPRNIHHHGHDSEESAKVYESREDCDSCGRKTSFTREDPIHELELSNGKKIRVCKTCRTKTLKMKSENLDEMRRGTFKSSATMFKVLQRAKKLSAKEKQFKKDFEKEFGKEPKTEVDPYKEHWGRNEAFEEYLNSLNEQEQEELNTLLEKASDEEVDDFLTELSKKTLGSYVKKGKLNLMGNVPSGNAGIRFYRKLKTREVGIDRAIDRLTDTNIWPPYTGKSQKDPYKRIFKI